MLINKQTEKTLFDYYILMIPKKAKEKFDSEQGEKEEYIQVYETKAVHMDSNTQGQSARVSEK